MGTASGGAGERVRSSKFKDRAQVQRVNMVPTVLLNNHFVSADNARVSVFEGGWLHGAGLFETMRAENGRLFRLESHIERLLRSAASILPSVDRENLPSRGSFEDLLSRNQLDSARVRLTVTAGSMLGQSDAPPSPTVCVTASPLAGYPAQLYEEGVQVAISEFRVSTGDPIARHKTTSYLPRLLGLREAQEARCIEALWFTTKHTLAEGCISNVFIVSKGVLKTPPLDTPVLPGITRDVVLDIARQAGVTAEEVPLTIDELLDADEVFLTNAVMRIMPVVRVEKRDVGEARVGDVTRRISDAYRALVRQECGR